MTTKTEFIPARWQRGWLGARINSWRRRTWNGAHAKIVSTGSRLRATPAQLAALKGRFSKA